MSAINVGNQFLSFSFQEELTSPNFNLGFKNIIKPGFYSPLSANLCTLVSTTKFQINQFSAWINATNAGAISISTSSAINVPTDISGLTISSSYPVFYMTYTHSTTYNSYADFGFCANINLLPTNALCICTCLFSGSNLIGFDYTNTTIGAVTPLGTNLGGYYAGNGNGEIPINNGVVNTNLNAQYFNGMALETTLSGDTTHVPRSDAVSTYISSLLLPVGSSMEYSGITVPTGWMKEDGSPLLMSSYSTLWSAISSSLGVCTISNGTPAVVTLASHGLQTGDCIHFTTDGSLPTGLSPSTNYYAIVINTSTFWLATTWANSQVPTKINTSSAGSGNHTLIWAPWGILNSTYFYLPDTQGISTEGSGQLTTNGAAWGSANYKGRLGQYKQDTIQGFALARISGKDSITGTDIDIWRIGTGALETPVSDGIHGTLRINYITNGPRVGKYKIIKVI